jgi:hypothetical protein
MKHIEDEYLSKEFQNYLENFDPQNAPISEFIAEVEEAWNHDYGALHTQELENCYEVVFITGGWSDNEDIINHIMMNEKLLQVLVYEQWNRGGKFIFRIYK